MDNFKRNNYTSHGFSKVELFVIFFAVVLILVVVVPKGRSLILNIKLNGAIDSFNSYKESINNFYANNLLIDDSFKLDGFYRVDNGNLVTDYDSYNIRISGNIPSDGYLSYSNNMLVDGCVVVGSYAIRVVEGVVDSVSIGSCDVTELDVAFGI